METNSNILKTVTQYVLIGILVLITLFGLSLKANAQSTSLGLDVDKINNSMVIQLTNQDFDILIPKITKDELDLIKDASFNQMVYVTGAESGYYFYMGSEWEEQSVREVFNLIDYNLAIQQPNGESLIVIAEGNSSEYLVDYNAHIKQVYHGFTFNRQDNSMAINIEKE